ncbi:MAG: hypothetical protein Q7U10_11695 [Thermodesulfovibrionia bacterium]|nr:hypothetical protein [Thermodesulfovibrionia bacterium]
MTNYYHKFHIPVMGTGHSIDTPIRVAHLGIQSVISLVDDILFEPVRKYYCEKFGLPYTEITVKEEDGRAKRTTAYLNLVDKIVRIKFDAIRKEPFAPGSEKCKYFELLPDYSPLKQDYERAMAMKPGAEREALEKELAARMVPGSIDVNIMVKLDNLNYDSKGDLLPEEYSDSKAALRGYANSTLSSGIELSAGMNQRLFHYMTEFRDFYRDEKGGIKKRIILKVSDFRSSIIQGKFLAKKGLEVYEFRIESGLNCGGHVFPTNGVLLPSILQEFKENRETLTKDFHLPIQKYYEKMGWHYPESALSAQPLITVQGGIGTYAETRRLTEDFGMDMTGWGTPFLLVPETTCIDDTTLELLRRSGEKDLYISDSSPIGVQFSNIHGTGAEIWTRQRVLDGRAGSPCGKGFLKFNTEFTEKPICLSSRQYEKLKLEEIAGLEITDEEKNKMIENVVNKECICDQLGNGCLIALGLVDEKDAPQCICPGPNIAWFNKIYTLKEMVDHIYGRGSSLVSSDRPHMFAKEIELYVDQFEKRVSNCGYTPKEIKSLQEFKENFEASIDFCSEVAKREPYPGENLESISRYIKEQNTRFSSIYAAFEKKADSAVVSKS